MAATKTAATKSATKAPAKAKFTYSATFQKGKDETKYRLVAGPKGLVKTGRFGGKPVLVVDPKALTILAHEAMRDVSFLLRPKHQQQVASILSDPEASPNDRFMASTLLRNAVISSKFELPFCQDTGTATVVAWKGQQVWTGADDAAALSKGIWKTYTKENLRYSQTAALTMYDEVNTGNNLPAQIDIYATKGAEYKFLFVAKGGGSANKSYLFQETKALLNPASLEAFLVEKMKGLGTAACPPYHIAIVVGGTSAESVLKTVKLASTGYYDTLPTTGDRTGRAFRDLELEKKMLAAAQKLGFGAQFGGKYFAHDVRVIRLPRHGASCPVGLGVSCSADRNVFAKIDAKGLWLEELERHPEALLPVHTGAPKEHKGLVKIDLNRPMKEILAELSKYPVATPLALTGRLVVARDIAHAKLKAHLDAGADLPQYFKDHPVYYAGPAKTPKGKASGSFGPTTAGRMDSYVDLFQSKGGSMVMIAKGNRSPKVTEACKKWGGFYLGSPGGPAAILAEENIKKVAVLEFPELGMEAIWAIDVVDFPAFILVDDKGNDFFQQLK
ncbi:MAG TPA: fumarate hydratase [Thermoanaerobaculia bacterium]|nr:fumarate hydratase [Thermoanaerobaculia bacterium]HQR66046.1 fumarate hydratase [Thermoanaerobaculia bacterium]